MSHTERADQLAAEAGKAMRAALDATADLATDAGGWANYTGSGREAADRIMWERVRALQAQAQIHATLALNDTLFMHGRTQLPPHFQHGPPEVPMGS